MNPQIQQMAREVSHQVAEGRSIPPHPVERVSAHELTVEIDAEPYPEIPAAFAEFCRRTGTDARLVGYMVRPVFGTDEIRARVSATVEVGGETVVGRGVDEDVVTGAVQAFAAAARVK